MENGGTNGFGTYTIPKVDSGLKEYYIEEENYGGKTKFGSVGGKLIAPVEGSSGEPRFYIMALEDINPGTTYCWYSAASNGQMNDYANTTSEDFGTGAKNIQTMIAKWDASEYGVQNSDEMYADMWGVEELRKKVNDGWFVPSRAEWSAFADMATKELGLTTDNYENYGLKESSYWSSSQFSKNGAYRTGFSSGFIVANNVWQDYPVRLSANF